MEAETGKNIAGMHTQPGISITHAHPFVLKHNWPNYCFCACVTLIRASFSYFPLTSVHFYLVPGMLYPAGLKLDISYATKPGAKPEEKRRPTRQDAGSPPSKRRSLGSSRDAGYGDGFVRNVRNDRVSVVHQRDSIDHGRGGKRSRMDAEVLPPNNSRRHEDLGCVLCCAVLCVWYTPALGGGERGWW